MVTHDVDEAVLLSDRVVMMTNGPPPRIGEVLDGGPAAPARAPRARQRPALSWICAQAVLEFLYQKQLKQAA